MTSQLELGKLGEKRKPEKQVNGIFWILLLNIGVYVADHVFQVQINLPYCNTLLCMSGRIDLGVAPNGAYGKKIQMWKSMKTKKNATKKKMKTKLWRTLLLL